LNTSVTVRHPSPTFPAGADALRPLYTRFLTAGLGSFIDYTFTAMAGAKAEASPVPRRQHARQQCHLQTWNMGIGRAEYSLAIGSKRRGSNVYNQSGLNTSVTVFGRCPPGAGRSTSVSTPLPNDGLAVSIDYHPYRHGGCEGRTGDATPAAPWDPTPPFTWEPRAPGPAEYSTRDREQCRGSNVYNQSQGLNTLLTVFDAARGRRPPLRPLVHPLPDRRLAVHRLHLHGGWEHQPRDGNHQRRPPPGFLNNQRMLTVPDGPRVAEHQASSP